MTSKNSYNITYTHSASDKPEMMGISAVDMQEALDKAIKYGYIMSYDNYEVIEIRLVD